MHESRDLIADQSTLQDETTPKDGDLYIRSVCFSPDGKFLATGAEDHVIRVWDITKRKVKWMLMGHEQDIYSLDWSKDGRCIVSGSGDRSVKVCIYTLASCGSPFSLPCPSGLGRGDGQVRQDDDERN